MPCFEVKTPQRIYPALVERGAVARVLDFIPPKAGRIVTTEGKIDSEEIAQRFERHRGDLRELLFELYDVYEERRGPQP
jgi:hypothetical protein